MIQSYLDGKIAGVVFIPTNFLASCGRQGRCEYNGAGEHCLDGASVIATWITSNTIALINYKSIVTTEIILNINISNLRCESIRKPSGSLRSRICSRARIF